MLCIAALIGCRFLKKYKRMIIDQTEAVAILAAEQPGRKRLLRIGKQSGDL